jgi:hypothetical protein
MTVNGRPRRIGEFGNVDSPDDPMKIELMIYNKENIPDILEFIKNNGFPAKNEEGSQFIHVRVMHDGLPGWLKGNCVEDNKLSLRFSNGSQVKAVSSSGDAGRSEALSLLIIDEAAFVDSIDEIWASSQQTLATGGGAIVLSTPNGTGNFFHKTWVGAEAGTNGFNPIKLHWTLHPDREQDWRAKQDQLLGEKMAAQECDCDFITSGESVIDGVILEEYRQTLVQDPLEKRGIDSNLWIWQPPNYTKDYVLSADVSRGDGTDYSAFHVMEIESMEQVAE